MPCDWPGCEEEITNPAIRPSGRTIGGFCDEHNPFAEGEEVRGGEPNGE